jgi:parallel beta helix pectate lyase-like protein
MKIRFAPFARQALNGARFSPTCAYLIGYAAVSAVLSGLVEGRLFSDENMRFYAMASLARLDLSFGVVLGREGWIYHASSGAHYLHNPASHHNEGSASTRLIAENGGASTEPYQTIPGSTGQSDPPTSGATTPSFLGYGPKPLSTPVGAIVFNPGDDVNSRVRAAAAGTTFYFNPGIYRDGALQPKNNQKFYGAHGAILNGSHLITTWTQSDSNYYCTGQAQAGARGDPANGDGSPRAGYPESVFYDDAPVRPVTALANLTTGHFYFDYAAKRIYIHDNPAGHKVEAGLYSIAFGDQNKATGVIVQNLTIEKYDAPWQRFAIEAGSGWLVQDNEVRWNYGGGIQTNGSGALVKGNYIHDMGQNGVGSHFTINSTFDSNEIAHNGYWSGASFDWECGGGKMWSTTGLNYKNNYSHDNYGPGIWFDTNNYQGIIDGNRIINNKGNGIFWEVSYDGTISHNVVMYNGALEWSRQGGTWLWGANILISTSPNVEIYGNKIDGTGTGANLISLVQNNRSGDHGGHGTYQTTNTYVHDNIITDKDKNLSYSVGDGSHIAGNLGGVADYNRAGFFGDNNRWVNNRYFMPEINNRFWWNDVGNTFAQWKAATGENGTISQP